MEKSNTTIEKAFSFLKEKGIYGLSYFKLLGITDNNQIKRILHKAESEGIIKLPISLVENTWLPPSDTHGWGNGYVFLDETHPVYGLPYGDIHLTDIGAVPGGITYSQWSNELGEQEFDLKSGKYWVVGFDTVHSFNNSSHNKQWVYNHTLNFLIDLYANLS
jgi:hypothetical protein